MQVSNTLKRTLPPRARGGCLQIGAQLNLSLADEDLAEKKKLRGLECMAMGSSRFCGFDCACHCGGSVVSRKDCQCARHPWQWQIRSGSLARHTAEFV